MSPRAKGPKAKKPARGPMMVPPGTMRDLRRLLPVSSSGWYYRRARTQAEAAALLGVSKRTVERWETDDSGAPLVNAWAYVGVAYRLGAQEAAQPVLERLAQLGLPGSDVWGKGGES